MGAKKKVPIVVSKADVRRMAILERATEACEDLGDDIEIVNQARIDETPDGFWVEARVYVAKPAPEPTKKGRKA